MTHRSSSHLIVDLIAGDLSLLENVVCLGILCGLQELCIQATHGPHTSKLILSAIMSSANWLVLPIVQGVALEVALMLLVVDSLKAHLLLI